jgi:hypothetical protein
VAERLPGAWWHVAEGRLRLAEKLYGCVLTFGADEELGQGESNATPALAVLIALLKALGDQHD